jgi:polygalacturonase
MTRRQLLRTAAILATAPDMGARQTETSRKAILARIKEPVFPKRDFDIRRYGAKAGGSTKCTESIAKAIRECGAAGGGRVVIPDGVFLTGALHLESNVNLYLASGSKLLVSTDPADYLPVV